MRSSRKDIRDAVKARLVELFDKETGGTLPRIRRFHSGQWKPGSSQLPAITVTGAAQSKADRAQDTETEKTLEYGVEILLELKENWDDGEQYDAWESFVQELIEQLYNWLPIASAMRFDYAGDEPPDVQLTFGPNVEMWIIRFDCTYAVDVGIIGKQ